MFQNLPEKTRLHQYHNGYLNQGVWIPKKRFAPEEKLDTFEHDISETSEYKPEAGRYHIYFGLGCPFSHRAHLVYVLKGLENIVSHSFLSDTYYSENGWNFLPENDAEKDVVFGKQALWQVYKACKDDFHGQCSVPLLVDKKTKTIVSGESLHIAKIFNSAFNKITGNSVNIFLGESENTKTLFQDFWNIMTYHRLIITNQTQYDASMKKIEFMMKQLDYHFSKNKFFDSDENLNWTDLKLFANLIRHDVIVAPLNYICFRVEDFVNLRRWIRDVYNHGKIKDTVNFEHIKKLYGLNPVTNPWGIIPQTKVVDYSKY